MSRVTKEIATEVAKILTSAKKSEYKSLEVELSDTVKGYYNANVPDKVKEFYSEFPTYINTQSSVKLMGNGFSYEYISVEGYVITNKERCTCLTPSDDQAKVIHGLKNKIQDIKAEYDKLFSDIENALLSLRTYSKIEKEFPEAFVHLPNRITTALAININSIREKLPQQAA